MRYKVILSSDLGNNWSPARHVLSREEHLQDAREGYRARAAGLRLQADALDQKAAALASLSDDAAYWLYSRRRTRKPT